MLILKKTIVPCLSGCGFFLPSAGRTDELAGLWMVGLAFGWTGETFVFHLTSIRGFCKCVIISILSKLLLLLGVSESTQIHPCFL